jgi:hypothetical protein
MGGRCGAEPCVKIKCHVDGTLVPHFALATLVYRSKITAPLNASKGVKESRIRNQNCDCNAEDASSCQEIKLVITNLENVRRIRGCRDLCYSD